MLWRFLGLSSLRKSDRQQIRQLAPKLRFTAPITRLIIARHFLMTPFRRRSRRCAPAPPATTPQGCHPCPWAPGCRSPTSARSSITRTSARCCRTSFVRKLVVASSCFRLPSLRSAANRLAPATGTRRRPLPRHSQCLPSGHQASSLFLLLPRAVPNRNHDVVAYVAYVEADLAIDLLRHCPGALGRLLVACGAQVSLISGRHPLY